MNKEWQVLLEEEMNKDYYKELIKSVAKRREQAIVYPPEPLVFSAFSMDPKDINVVILGQDPYHGNGQAHGMSFSVLPGIKLPPSLKNIYKEITAEFGYSMPKDNGYLMPWAEQGVFLLNSVLTVEEGNPNSHKDLGWGNFTDAVIKKLSDEREGVVFMLWGNFSKNKASLIDGNKHLILEGFHPSPFSARHGFFGCNHFIKANEYLRANGKGEIDWSIGE